MPAQKIRASQDIHLFETLLTDPSVMRVNDSIARQEAEGVMGTRRQLLATSVRLSEAMAPSLHKMAQDCSAALGVTIPVELYVYNSPQFNAACVKPEDGRLFIMFSSSLLEGFDEDELRFVMGHELGHYVYQHHDIPIGYLLHSKAKPSPDLALTLTSWSRYAEFSADRAGAHCTQNENAVARALFKLASGLTGNVVTFQLDDFLKQVDEMKVEDDTSGTSASTADWFSTHPFSPLRVKALQLFHQSSLFTESHTLSQVELESGIERLMNFMEASYLEGHTDTAKYMRRLLFAGSLVIANAHKGISKAEISAFEKFFGKHAYKENLDLDYLKNDLAKRAEQVKENTSMAKRMQVLHDLCIIAKADKDIAQAEFAILNEIAARLDVPKSFIEKAMLDVEELD